MDAAPPLSVLMPVRDGARFLDAAATSIFAQDCSAFEFIAVDDGSADETPALLAGWARRDARLRVLTQPPRGIVAALNAGLAAARADLVVRMDADDVALPHRLRALHAAAESWPEAAAIGSAYAVVDESGTVRREVRLPEGDAAIRTCLPRSNPMAHPTVLLRRAAVLEAGGYRDGFPGCEDYDLWLRLVERHALRNLPDVLLHYRAHAAQATRADLRRRLHAEAAALHEAAVRAGRETPELAPHALRRRIAARAWLAARGAAGERRWTDAMRAGWVAVSEMADPG